MGTLGLIPQINIPQLLPLSGPWWEAGQLRWAASDLHDPVQIEIIFHGISKESLPA